MPDLINPEYWSDDGDKHILWFDELCASCKASGNCPLIQVMYQHKILTASGCHVINCELYDADTTSPHYVPPDADMEAIRTVNVETIQQSVDLLNDLLGKAIADVSV